jgi:hypothetical protein
LLAVYFINIIMDKITLLLKKAYYALNTRDIDAALATMHPNVIWQNSMEERLVEGHSSLREYWTKQWEMVDPDVEPVSIIYDKCGKATANVHQVIRDLNENIIKDEIVQHICLIEDDLIKHVQVEKLAEAV